ncbi:MAG: type IV pilus twitching motility protein PilT [Fimbriimonadaceae bacterium]|nr:type IV pilus twitching motility protein PilT [Fimbriimonadaceae bacterium]
MRLDDLLVRGLEARASDVFLKYDTPPAMRIHGDVVPIDGSLPRLQREDIDRYLGEIMRPEQIARFHESWESDLSYMLPGRCRFRVNVYKQRGTIGIVFRVIPLEVPKLEELGLPPVCRRIAANRTGFILVTGPTGSGKSTTLASIVDLINRHRSGHIVTIEDPIEFIHPDRKCIVSQREVAVDTHEFQVALRSVLRQAPDVILIGEMRDRESIGVAMQAAETGHLVLSTLHTNSASETVERIVNMFPPHEKPQICLRLGNTLKAVISQQLVPLRAGKGRALACEVMVVNPTIAGHIEEGNIGNIYGIMKQSEEQYGMQTMNMCLDRLVKNELIDPREALARAGNLAELKMMLRRSEEDE